MQRTHQPLPPFEASDALPAPAAGPSARALLERLRGPGTVKVEVDALLQALGGPPSGAETPRERADLLLALLEDAEVRELTGTDGRTVRTAAVEGLLALGYPYALEIPPEALAQARASSGAAGAPGMPVAGLVVGALAVLVQALLDLRPTPTALALFLGAGVLPLMLAVLGGSQRLRWAQGVGVTLMTVMGLAHLARFAGGLFRLLDGMGSRLALGPLIVGVLLPLAAWLLRRPWTDTDASP